MVHFRGDQMAMNLDDIIKEYENIKLRSSVCVQKEKKSFPHIVSKDSFEKLIMNAVEQVFPPKQINAQHVDPPAQQTSVITANSSHRKISSDHKRIRFMQRQQNVEESAESADNGKSEPSSSDNEYSMRGSYSLKQHISFESALHDANSKYKRESYQGNFKSKSLDVLGDSHANMTSDISSNLSFRLPKHGSYNYEDEFPVRHMNKLHIAPTAHMKALRISPVYSDTRSALSPHGSLQNSPQSNMRNSPQNSVQTNQDCDVQVSPLRNVQNGQCNVIPADPQNMRLSPRFKIRPYDSQQMRQYKYGQSKSHSAAACSPYDRVYREKNLRRIFSEEIFPENSFMDRSRKIESSNLRRSSSYDTFGAFLLHSRQDTSHTGDAIPRDFLRQPSGKQPSTQIIFPEHDNVKEYKDIFTKPTDDDVSQALHLTSMMENSFLYNVGHMKGEEKQKRKNENAKSKGSKPQPSDAMYSSGPYQYDKDTDDELAVCVSGLLTLPGSNEKR